MVLLNLRNLIVWCFAARLLVLDASGMEMNISLDSVAPRSMAPIPVTVTMRGDRPLTEGHLRIRLFEGKRQLIDYRTAPLIVTNAMWKRRFLLPAIPASNRLGNQAEFRLTFETDQERYEKEGLFVTVPGSEQRIAVVAVVFPDAKFTPDGLRDLLNEGRLETVMGVDQKRKEPGPGVIRFNHNRVLTWQAPLRPGQVPGEPLWFTAYDMVALAPDSLALLSERQLDALATWVRAGGSVLIRRHPDISLPGSAAIHGFLKNVKDKGRAAPILSPDLQEDLGVQLEARQWDLGRVVLLDGLGVETDSEAPEWREVFNFLWNLPEAKGEDDKSATFFVGHHGISNQTSRLRSAINSTLMPTGVTLLPISQIVGLMAFLLVVGGLLEYDLLRRLRRRWLTWYTFPFALIAFTLGSFALGDHLMGKDSVKRLTFVDLSLDGQESVREHRVTMTFARSSERKLTPRRRSLVAPLVEQRVARMNVLSHQGRYPAAFDTARWSQQWTPYMDHVTTLESTISVPPALAGIDWEAMHPNRFANSESAAEALSEKLGQLNGIHSPVFVGQSSDGGRGFVRLLTKEFDPIANEGIAPGSIIESVSDYDSLRFPRMASPRGDRLFSDWLVPGHDQWLVLIQNGEDRLIFRYLYPEHG